MSLLVCHLLIGDMASTNSLPEGLITRCLDVLRVLSFSERDLFLMIVEIVHELRDSVKGSDETVGTISQALYNLFTLHHHSHR